MAPIDRRTALGALGAGAALVTAGCAATPRDAKARPEPTTYVGHTGANPVSRENARTGSSAWKIKSPLRSSRDEGGQIQGYASATSVAPGDPISFHLSVRPGGPFRIEIYRRGWYGGTGGRLLATSPQLHGSPQPIPQPAAGTREIDCTWPASWTLDIPRHWISGHYLAVFTSAAGYRAYTQFVVREETRRSDFLVVVPFTTYQAYNAWPLDGHTGRNLYTGYDAHGKLAGLPQRSYKVSFNRPYCHNGLAEHADIDLNFTTWAEQNGYDLTYASSLDLHQGRIRPDRYRALVFPGHDEYWTLPMRQVLEQALDRNVHVAFLSSNPVYWRARFEAAQGTPDRIMACYKYIPDPAARTEGPTNMWRSQGKDHALAEQGLIGVQYNGVVKGEVPLVVRQSDHWLWRGTGVRDGDAIPGLIGVEGDGFDPRMPRPKAAVHAFLSHSPYTDRMNGSHQIQQTSCYETDAGTVVFAAGTFNWTRALADPAHTDPRVQTVTRNLFTRLLHTT